MTTVDLLPAVEQLPDMTPEMFSEQFRDFVLMSLLSDAGVGISPRDVSYVLAGRPLVREEWPSPSTFQEYGPTRHLVHEPQPGKWSDLGAPAGDPADAPPIDDGLDPDAIDYDITLELPVAYSPQVAPDEYRCFLIDWPEDQEKYVTAFKATPGDRAIVHHVIAYIIPPAQVPEYDALDAADPDPGYLCYGGPGGTRPSWLGTWVPGGTSSGAPAGTGVRVVPGSKIAVQIHYHALPGAGPDQTELAVRTVDSVEREAFVIPFTNPSWLGSQDMKIPAGEADVVHETGLDLSKGAPLWIPGSNFNSGDPLQIHALGLHMHTLGTSASITIERGDGGACGLTIPRWDFNWQGSYQLAQPLTIELGDTLRLQCRWDNSAAKQPIVDGSPQTPKDVYWGEGTGDEMCLGTAYITGV